MTKAPNLIENLVVIGEWVVARWASIGIQSQYRACMSERVLTVVSVTTVANGKVKVTLVKGNATTKVTTCIRS